VKITAVDCQAIGLAFGQSTGALTGTADSWYAPRKNRNAMSESCSMRNQTNNLALFHDGVDWRRESILRLSSHWVTLSAFRHSVSCVGIPHSSITSSWPVVSVTCKLNASGNRVASSRCVIQDAESALGTDLMR